MQVLSKCSFFSLDIYTFRNLANMTQDFFKEVQKIHNNKDINNKNTFISGTVTYLDDQNRLNEKVTIRLFPHQIFVCPREYVTKIKNRNSLMTEFGLEFYQSATLRYVNIFCLS